MATEFKPTKGATAEDVRRAFDEFLTALSPEERQRLNRAPTFDKMLTEQRRAAILAHVESPEVREWRRVMVDTVKNSSPPPAH